MANGIEYDPYLGVWIDPQGIIYELKDKNIADTIEFEMIDGGEYELSNIYRDWETDRKSTRLNSSHSGESRMPSSA